jgi:signal transduction histidine kinase
MHLPRRLLPRTLTAQITTLVIAAVLLGVSLTSAVLLYLTYDWRASVSPELFAAAGAARIATVIKQAEASRSPSELAQVVATARWPGVHVELIPTARLVPTRESAPRHRSPAGMIRDILEDTWGLVPVKNAAPPGQADSIVVEINDDSSLVFLASPYGPVQTFILVQAAVALGIIIVILLFLSTYAVRWVTSPLSLIASAARSFGRLREEDRSLSEDGPREIAQVAEALNDMRKRVRSLVDDRTRMLAAISHDLRTPLTRLRLRAERLTDAGARHSMLNDIATVNDMIGETLIYLREGGRSEPVHLVDLPSLLQTICTEFSDVGHTVSYEGPGRFPFACRAHALTRAVTNIVDNGTKHGSTVVVTLYVLADMTAKVEVSDDGPGIAHSLREKVFEPFFKGDSARPSPGRGGFGLGLSIARDIVERDGGEIALLDHVPQGLTVHLSLNASKVELGSAMPTMAGAA